SKVAEGPAKNSVALRAREPRPGFSGVFGAGYRSAGNENPIGIVGINANLIESVPGFSAKIVPCGIHLAPRPAAIIGAVDLAADRPLAGRRAGRLRCGWRFRCFVSIVDDRVENVRVLLIEIQPDSSNDAFRQSSGQLLPVGAAVGRLINPTSGASVFQPPRT